jgi:heat shock protein HslJ
VLSPTEQLRQRYPELLPANADPALARAIGELDAAARTAQAALTPPAWLTQLTWERPASRRAISTGAPLSGVGTDGPAAARVAEAADHVRTRAARWRPWAELAAALVIFGLVAALLALVLRPSSEEPGLGGASPSSSFASSTSLSSALPPEHGAGLSDVEDVLRLAREQHRLDVGFDGQKPRVLSIRLDTLGAVRSQGNWAERVEYLMDGVPEMPVWKVEIDQFEGTHECPSMADPVNCVWDHLVLVFNAVTAEQLGMLYPDGYVQGQPSLPTLAPDASVSDIDAALARAHELAPGVAGRPSRAIGAWLLPRGQTWGTDDGDAQALVWQVELLDASDLPNCSDACPRDHLTLLIDPATGAELARRDSGPAPAVTLAPWPTPRPATPDPNRLVVPEDAVLPTTNEAEVAARVIARERLGAQQPAFGQVSLTTPQQALYIMQDRGVAVAPLWDPSEANETVWWLELVGDVFHNPDCASCPDAPKAYMGLRPSDGALLWLATEIPPDVVTHTPTPPPTSTPAVSPTPAALDPALLNTSWTLAALDGEQPVGVVVVTITFYDAALDIFSGCNYVSAPYLAASDGTLILGGWVSTAMACVGPAAAAQETRFRDLLFAVARYRLAGSTLRLETADGRALIFSRAESVLPAVKPTGTLVLPTEEPLPPLPTGIFEHYDGAGSSIFRTVNYWQGMTSDGFKMALAGRAVDTTTGHDGPGAVRVDSIPTDERGAATGQQQMLGVFTPAVDHGALRIDTVDGDKLFPTAEDGTALTFDMVALAFADGS